MNCPEFEMRIADTDLNSHELARHLEECSACRQFAEQLAADREALRSAPPELAEVDFARMRAELRARMVAERRPLHRWAIAACMLLAAGAGFVWRRPGVPAIAPPVVARAVAKAAPIVAIPPHEGAAVRKKMRRATPRPDPVLEASLQAFLAKEQAAATPAFPPEKGVRIETGDPHIVLILVSADSGGSHE